MKKFNLKHITSLILTLILLQGCMPDSLTKFNKDTPKKTTTVAATAPTPTTTTTTPSGEVFTPVYPTVGTTFNYTEAGKIIAITTKDLPVDRSVALSAGLIEPATTVAGIVSPGDITVNVASTNLFPKSGSIKIGTEVITYTNKTATSFTGLTTTAGHAISDAVAPPAPLFGSLADPTKFSSIFLRCSLDTSGTTITQNLPPGMIFNPTTCGISGKPTRPYCDPIGCTNINYTVNLFYKSDAAGTEKKLTSTIALGSYYFTDNPATILTAAITAIDDPIAVSSTNLFPNSGSIMVNNEIIAYAAKTALSFTTLTRGASATVAASHLINTVVTPYPDLSGVKDTLGINYPELDPLIADGFSYIETIAGVTSPITTKDMLVGTPVEFDPKTIGHDTSVTAIDGPGGTLSNPARAPYIFLKCTLDQSGPLSTRTLPPGLLLNENTCLITGTPTAAFSDTTFGNMGGNVTYKVDLFHKGANYLGDGTEIKVTALFKLKAHVQPVLSPWIPPTSFGFALVGSTTSSLVANFEVNVATKYIPVLNGTLNLSDKFAFSYVDCALDATTPTLPPGVNLVSTTSCHLNGTPTALPPLPNPAIYKINLRYKDNTNTVQTIQAAVSVGIYIKPTLLTYNQHDRLLLKLDNTTSLDSNTPAVNYKRTGLLTSSNGVTGVVNVIDSVNSVVGVVRTTPLTLADATGFVKDLFIYSAGGAIGKIQNVVGNIVYVERLTPTVNFLATEGVIHSGVYPGVYVGPLTTTIASINTAYVFDMSVANFDNDDQFYSAKYSMSTLTRVYSVGTTIDNITPVPSTQLSALNGITYSISPALPGSGMAPDLTFNTTTGVIAGKFSSIFDSTKFTITATNLLGSTSFSLYLSAIQPPLDLSLTNKQIVTVSSTALFNEGENLFEPIIAPLVEGTRGQIRKIIDGNTLAVNAYNNSFAQNASLDSGNSYYSEKSYVLADNSCSDSSYILQATCTGAGGAWSLGSYYYNIALSVVDASTFTVGGYVSSSTGAQGKVVKIAANILYVQFLTPATTYSAFSEGDLIDNVATYVATKTTITQVENDNLKVTLSGAGFNKGDDLATSDTLRSGYIYKAPAATPTIVYVSDISRKNTATFFQKTQTVSNTEKYAAADGTVTPPIVSATINGVANENLFTVDKGVSTLIKANLTTGNLVTYSISPLLPAGLVLDVKTGNITGKATALSAEKSYTMIAQNLIGISTFYFKLEVRDYFSLSQNSSGSSFLIHKYGDNQQSRKCRINASDILNGTQNANALDVRCMLESEEEDLYFNPVKFAASAGAGICEFVQYAPYAFWQYAPYKTIASIDYVSGCAGAAGVPGGATTIAPSSANSCVGNYTAALGPNCDPGKLTVTTYTTSVVAGTCTLGSTATSTVDCGGMTGNCLNGPVKDLLSDTAINNGSRSVVYSTSTGIDQSWTLSSPIAKGDYTNLRVSNNIVGNQCSINRKDVNDWTKRASKLSPVVFPWGSSTPYYTFNCLNAAQEIKGRIRVVVREWDQAFNITDNLSFNSPAKMNKLTAIDPIFARPYNNTSDWDDAYNLGAAVYGSCSNALYNNFSDCNGAGAVWTANPANCTNSAYAGQVACEAAGYSWTVCGATQGSCSLGAAYKNQNQCEKVLGVWTGDEDYKFPEDSM
jgi:hypothetical protein